MSVRIALVGNPNCGKTTMFNELTGSSQYVGNWPGVTVEKKEGKLKGHKDIFVVDLPGIYSLSPYTLEEVITRNFLIGERPDVIINLVDATNIERNLYLTTQLAEIGIPVVVSLNMIDIIRKNGDEINLKILKERLGCEIVETSAIKGTGLDEVIKKAVSASHKPAVKPPRIFSDKVERALTRIESILRGSVPEDRLRWFSIKLFERDEMVLKELELSAADMELVEEFIVKCEEFFEDTSESIIINERYEYITGIVKESIKKKTSNMTVSDRIDLVLTDRWLALPLFVAIMWAVYYISITSIGSFVTEWTNNTLLGEIITGNVQAWLEAAGTADWLVSLIIEGIIGGVGAVLGFVPQLVVLFFLLSILEDCGYMARIAFIMDRIFRKFGLSGKSFIPMLIASGCGVPGIMASRTIESEKDRRMTIIVTTFIPCGAKLPVIALIGGVRFPQNTWVAPSIYFLGICAIVISGIILKKTRLFTGETSPFVMELPQYHIPGLKSVAMHVWERISSFVVKAGTVIFLACGTIWFLSNFGWDMRQVTAEGSILASLGKVIAPLFAPLGFGDWKPVVATISGLIAKENIVGTLGVLFGGASGAVGDASVTASIGMAFTKVSAYSFIVFNMLCAPCFAAIGAIKREMGGLKWTFLAIGYQTALAYVVSFVIYQLGSVYFLGKPLGVGAYFAFLAVLSVLWLLIRKGSGEKVAKDPAKAEREVLL
ncbi:MAG: Ferrous iron transport protein B [Firmicutes bacterium ADurb.Bin193]|nr:MAG: Ferrous iron transport protein B [Firmicutes bacterium ADurb.Bin193]